VLTCLACHHPERSTADARTPRQDRGRLHAYHEGIHYSGRLYSNAHGQYDTESPLLEKRAGIGNHLLLLVVMGSDGAGAAAAAISLAALAAVLAVTRAVGALRVTWRSRRTSCHSPRIAARSHRRCVENYQLSLNSR
jgi:hypothetical protein